MSLCVAQALVGKPFIIFFLSPYNIDKSKIGQVSVQPGKRPYHKACQLFIRLHKTEMGKGYLFNLSIHRETKERTFEKNAL